MAVDDREKKTDRPITIRPYEPGDLERVRDLTASGFAGVIVDYAIDQRWPSAGALPWAERKFLDVSADLANSPSSCFVATEGDEVVGFITSIVSPAKGQGYVRDLVVDASRRGRGIGRSLLERALAEFRRRGLRIARIETLAHNGAGAHLFPAVGFQQVATQNHYAMDLSEE